MIETPLQRRAPLPPQLTRRVGLLGVVALVLFGILAFRLWYLQVLTGTQNAAMATANVVRDVAIPPPRGNILDRNGNVIATYRIAPEVAIVADELPPAGPQRRLVYRRLARVLGMSWQEVRAVVDDRAVAPPGYAPTDIMDDVPTRAWVYIGERGPLFPGVIERQVYVRYYPEGPIGAVVLGQLGQITPRGDRRSAVQGGGRRHDRRSDGARGHLSELPAGHPGRRARRRRCGRLPDRRQDHHPPAGVRGPAEQLARPRAREGGLHRRATKPSGGRAATAIRRPPRPSWRWIR